MGATGYLSVDEPLAGAALTPDIVTPPGVRGPPAPSGAAGAEAAVRKVRMRPLTVRDLQRVGKAARDDDSLLSVLMLKEAMGEPALTLDQVHGLQAGLARFLLQELNRISGLAVDGDTLAGPVEAPPARACFILRRPLPVPPAPPRRPRRAAARGGGGRAGGGGGGRARGGAPPGRGGGAGGGGRPRHTRRRRGGRAGPEGPGGVARRGATAARWRGATVARRGTTGGRRSPTGGRRSAAGDPPATLRPARRRRPPTRLRSVIRAPCRHPR